MPRHMIPVVVLGVGLAFGLGSGGVDAAVARCAAGADACLVVNTTADTNARDTVLSLREALLVRWGTLAVADLTEAERGQVRIVQSLGLLRSVDVNFDPTVFCGDCGAAIQLVPPGLGNPDRIWPPIRDYSGEMLFSLPPGLGNPDSVPPGLGNPDRIGMGINEEGMEVPAPVVIDGGDMPSGHVGLWLGGAGSIRGVRFQHFADHAIEVEAEYAGSILLGPDGDGVNDRFEAVTFVGNGDDIVIVGEDDAHPNVPPADGHVPPPFVHRARR